MGIVGGNGRERRRLRERPNAFGVKRQKEFLKAFAGSCNIRAAAAECGVSTATVWHRRRDDEQFRVAFETAREQAIVNLESELIARGLELINAATPEDSAAAAFPGMDAKFLHTLVQCAKRDLGKAPGTARGGRSDPREAASRLSALLLRMRLERKRELEQQRSDRSR